MKLPMNEVRLTCLTLGSAEAVAAECDLPEQGHRARGDGATVVIAYIDHRYPLDVAEWAFNNGHCDDSAAGDVIGTL